MTLQSIPEDSNTRVYATPSLLMEDMRRRVRAVMGFRGYTYMGICASAILHVERTMCNLCSDEPIEVSELRLGAAAVFVVDQSNYWH